VNRESSACKGGVEEKRTCKAISNSAQKVGGSETKEDGRSKEEENFEEILKETCCKEGKIRAGKDEQELGESTGVLSEEKAAAGDNRRRKETEGSRRLHLQLASLLRFSMCYYVAGRNVSVIRLNEIKSNMALMMVDRPQPITTW